MLQVNHISLAYGACVILDDISFTVAPGEKAGLIGVNGAGKSSLLKIIAGLQQSDRGKISHPQSFGYLSQDVAHDTSVADGITVREFVFSSTGLDQAARNYEELSAQLGEAGDDLEERLRRFEAAQEPLHTLCYSPPTPHLQPL